MSGLSDVSGSVRAPVNFATKLVQMVFAILICAFQCTSMRLLALDEEKLAYEWIVCRFFIMRGINQAEVDLARGMADA